MPCAVSSAPGRAEQSDRPKNFDILLAAQALERIGDHAKNLAEELYGLSEGRSLRHNARKLSTAVDCALVQ